MNVPLNRRQVAAIALVLVLAVGGVGAYTALFTGGAGVTYEASSGLTVTAGVAHDVSSQNPFTASDTIYIDGVRFQAAGAASVTVDRFTGSWTNVSAVNATTADLTVDPDDKSAVTISGQITALRYRTDSATALDDGQVDFVYSAGGSGTLTLRSLPADTTVSAVTASGDPLGSVTTDGTGTATFSLSSHTDAKVLLFSSSAPTLSNPDPSGKVSSYDGNISITVNDTDFDTPHADSVTVEAINDSGGTIGTATISSNQTITFDYSAPPGKNNVTWTATDAYDNTGSYTQEFTTPSVLYVYNETNSSALVDNTTLRFRFFGEGDTVVQRTVSDGTVSLSGLPANERFVVTVSDENEDFYYRRIIVTSVYQQEEIYLLPRSAAAVQIEFRFYDYTGGQFPPQNTRLYIEAPITKDFDGDGTNETNYQVIFGDNFGSAGSFPAVLAKSERYRLRIVNQDGDQRILGTYVADNDDVAPITVKGLEFTPPQGQGYDTTLTVSSDPRKLTWKYMDPSGKTEDLSVRVVNESGAVIYKDSVSGTVENYSVYDIPLDNETTYTLNWSATRGGTQIGAVRPIGGGAIGMEIPLQTDWLGTVGLIFVVFAMSLADARLTTYVSMTTVAMAGVLMALQAVFIYPPLWWLGALIATGSHLRTMQQGRI